MSATAHDGTRPDASIIVAAYNAVDYIAEAIESALAQRDCTVEVIVVDDGSRDGTADVVRRFPDVVLIEQANQGACAARNLGIARSRGRHLVFLDGDDRMLPDAVRTGLDALARTPGAAMAYGGFHRISARGAFLTTARQPEGIADHFAHMLRRNSIVLHSALFVRDAVERGGGFVPDPWEAADWDLYLRMARDHPAVCHGGIVAERRIHDTQASRANAPMLSSALVVLKRQWPWAKREPAWREAYAAGVKHYRDWFGEKLVLETHLLARQGKWVAAAKAFATLLRWHPDGAKALLRGLARSNTIAWPVWSLERPPAPAAPADDGRLALLALDPPAIAAGMRPARMQGDLLELDVHCRHATARTVVVLDDVPLDTRYVDPARLVALVPPGLLKATGTRTVYLLRQ